MRTFGIGRDMVGITSWRRCTAGSSPVSDSASELTGSAGTDLSTGEEAPAMGLQGLAEEEGSSV